MPPENKFRMPPPSEPVRGPDPVSRAPASHTPASQTPVSRILGGAPGPVLLRLVLLSIIVGMALVFFGLTPETFFHSLRDAFEDVFGVGIDALRNIGKYFLYGAAIVLPLWLVGRLMSRR